MVATDHQLVLLARIYGQALKLDTKTVSFRMFNDSKKLDALINGKDITVRRSQTAAQWLSDHWPEGAKWPEGIERPAASEDAA